MPIAVKESVPRPNPGEQGRPVRKLGLDRRATGSNETGPDHGQNPSCPCLMREPA